MHNGGQHDRNGFGSGRRNHGGGHGKQTRTGAGGAAGTLSKSFIQRDITAVGAITLAAANSASMNGLRFPDVGMGNAAQTAISATELSVNTHYKGSVATNLAMTIPSAAAGKIGDWITVVYNGVINNGQAHTYTTTTDTAYTLGSLIRVKAAVISEFDIIAPIAFCNALHEAYKGIKYSASSGKFAITESP